MRILKYCFLLAGLLTGVFCQAQTTHTDVLVNGGTASGVAAAIQAAHSGVKVLFIVETDELASNVLESDTVFNAGILANFSKLTLKARTDSVSGAVSPFSQSIASNVLKG